MTQQARGSLQTQGPTFTQAIKLGDVREWTVVSKSGASKVIGTTLAPVTTVGVYPTPTTPASLEMLSSSINDTSAGTGVRTVRVTGIGPDWQEQVEIVTLNGVTPVPLTNTWLRVYRLEVETQGAYPDGLTVAFYDSLITLRAAGAGAVWAEIPEEDTVGLGQSLIGCFTVPIGKRAYISGAQTVPESAKLVTAGFFVRENADVITPPVSPGKLVWINYSDSSPVNKSENVILGPYVGPCDLGFLAKVDVGTAGVTVDFTVFMENYVEPV